MEAVVNHVGERGHVQFVHVYVLVLWLQASEFFVRDPESLDSGLEIEQLDHQLAGEELLQGIVLLSQSSLEVRLQVSLGLLDLEGKSRELCVLDVVQLGNDVDRLVINGLEEAVDVGVIHLVVIGDSSLSDLSHALSPGVSSSDTQGPSELNHIV